MLFLKIIYYFLLSEEDTEKNVSLLLDGEEHEISFIDPPTMPETPVSFKKHLYAIFQIFFQLNKHPVMFISPVFSTMT